MLQKWASATCRCVYPLLHVAVYTDMPLSDLPGWHLLQLMRVNWVY